MKNVLLAITVTLSLGMGANALAAPAGTVIFTQPGSQIIAENGQTRPAKQGDVLESGERLLTPSGTISQVRLPDGSLVGLRPGAELKFDMPPSALDKATTVSLLQGSARVIGAELMDVKKPSTFTFLSGQATLKLQGADLETALVKPDANKPPGGNDAGSYNRLLIGTGSIGSGATVTPLEPRQVSFVGVTNVAPIAVASVSSTLFSPTIGLKTLDPSVGTKTVLVGDVNLPKTPITLKEAVPTPAPIITPGPIVMAGPSPILVKSPTPLIPPPPVVLPPPPMVITVISPVITINTPPPIQLTPLVLTCKIKGTC